MSIDRTVAHYLSTFMCSMLERSLNIHKDLTIKVLISMLRLGRKYAFTHFEKKALEALHHDYPTTLKEWDSLSHESRRIQHFFGRKKNLYITTQVISIGHEFDLFTILPAAYVSYLQHGSLVASRSICKLLVSDYFLWPDTDRKR